MTFPVFSLGLPYVLSHTNRQIESHVSLSLVDCLRLQTCKSWTLACLGMPRHQESKAESRVEVICTTNDHAKHQLLELAIGRI